MWVVLIQAIAEKYIELLYIATPPADQPVKKGEPLFQFDRRPYEYKVQQLKAQLQEALKLRGDSGGVCLDLLAREHRPLVGLSARVTDEPGAAANEPEWLVTGELKPTHEQQLHQIAEMQAGGGRVEPAVVGDRRTGQQCLKLISVRRHVH